MAGSHGWSLPLLLAVLLLTVSLTESAVIVVGGATGWTTTFDYAAWATSQNFQPRVGDSLVFFTPDSGYHTVSLVDSADAYQRCIFGANAVNPVTAGKNYTMIVPATLEGKMLYAVCTVSGHCAEGQKIKATVLPALNGSIVAPVASPGTTAPTTAPNSNDADLNRYICWTTAILLIAACFWTSA